MTAQDLQLLISNSLICAHVQVQGDGRHWFALIVSAEFEDCALILRHKKVYAALGGKMQNDEVHALSMKTMTPNEWEAVGRPRHFDY